LPSKLKTQDYVPAAKLNKFCRKVDKYWKNYQSFGRKYMVLSKTTSFFSSSWSNWCKQSNWFLLYPK
jgi:hypothetical protein